MKARIISSVAAAGVLALVISCSEDQSRGISVPTEATYAKAPTCSFSTANNDAKAYFSNSKDAVFTLLSAQQAAYKLGAANATSAGLAVLGRLGVATDLDLVKATADSVLGSKFANDVLLCTSLTGTDFSSALGPKGLFAVRTVGDTAAVLSRFELENGDPLYGAEPTTSDGWQFTGGWQLTTADAGKALFYASPVVSTIGDPTVGTVFDLKTLPTPLAFSPSIRVGVCDMTLSDGRIEHVHGSAVILPPDDPKFCTSSSVMIEPSRSVFAAVAHEMASWLAPRPAYAASRSMFAAFSGGGGLVTGLSEIGPVQVLEALTIDSIPNASVSDTSKALDGNPGTSQFTPIVTVHVVTTTGTPIAGVTVALEVIGNKGSFVPSGGTAVTGTNGTAVFPDFTLNKAGGYTVSAKVPELGGDVVAVSNLFNINGQ